LPSGRAFVDEWDLFCERKKSFHHRRFFFVEKTRLGPIQAFYCGEPAMDPRAKNCGMLFRVGKIFTPALFLDLRAGRPW